MRFVLDASVSLSWCLPDESNGYADGILAAVGEWQPVVPVLWMLEVTNALLVGWRRGRIDSDQLGEMSKGLSSIPVEIDSLTLRRTIHDVVPIARVLQLSVYDACYLELADRIGAPLATVDKVLKVAAEARGVPILQLSGDNSLS